MPRDYSDREQRGTPSYLAGNENAQPPEELRTKIRNRNGGTTSRFLYDLPLEERRRYETAMLDLQTNGGKRKEGHAPRFDNPPDLSKTRVRTKRAPVPPPPARPAPIPLPVPAREPLVVTSWLDEFTPAELVIVETLALWGQTAFGRGRLRALGRLLGEGGAVRGPSGPVGISRRVARAAPGDTRHTAPAPGTGARAAVAAAG